MECFLDKIYGLVVARGNVMFLKHEYISISFRPYIEFFWAQNVRG